MNAVCLKTQTIEENIEGSSGGVVVRALASHQ